MHHPEHARRHPSKRPAALPNNAQLEHTYRLTPTLTLSVVHACRNCPNAPCDEKTPAPKRTNPMHHYEQARLAAAEALADLINTQLTEHPYRTSAQLTLPIVDAIAHYAHALCDEKLAIPNRDPTPDP